MTRTEAIQFVHYGATFSGTLYTPDMPGRFPVIIVLHAAQGGLRTYPFYRHLTDILPAAGIAVLLYDRRGSGQSTGSFETADFQLLAADAQAAIDVLSKHPAIDTDRIGLYGISQGGWIAPIVAAQCPHVALLTIVSGCGVSPAEQMIYSTQTALRLAQYPETIIELATTLRRQVDAFYRGELPRGLVQAALNNARHEPWFAHTYHDSDLPGNVQNDKWYYEMDYDPIPIWSEVTQPVLFLYGEYELYIPTEESAHQYRMATAHIADVRIEHISGADHFMSYPNSQPNAAKAGEVSNEYLTILRTWLYEKFDVNTPM